MAVARAVLVAYSGSEGRKLMAAIALGFLGSAVGGAIGGSILGISAATIGGYIGSTLGGFIDQAVFGQTVEGPRLNDLMVTASTYGNAIPLAYGPNVRMAGNIVWSSGLIETSKKRRRGGKGSPGVSTREYSYHVHLAVALCEGEARRIKRIWANGKILFQDNGSGTDILPPGPPAPSIGLGWVRAGNGMQQAAAIRFYRGTFDQQPDTLIESYLGAGNAPAFVGTAYVVIERLELADFGNRIPNLEFELEAQEQISVAEIVSDVSARAGVPGIYASPVSDRTVNGYVVGRPATAWGALQPLALAFNFDIADKGGALTVVRRGRAPIATFDPGDLAAIGISGDGGTSRGRAVSVPREHDRALPRRSAITYRDIDRDYQSSTEAAERQFGGSDTRLNAEIALNLTATEARRIADRLLHEAWAGRETVDLALTDQWIDLNASDAVAVPLGSAGLAYMRIERINRNRAGICEVSLRSDDPEVYRSVAVRQAPPVPSNELDLVGNTKLVLIDAPILLDANDDDGFYWAATGQNQGWRGADIQRSIDGGVSYDGFAAATGEGDIGTVAGTVPAGPVLVWDRATVITVTLLPGGELESATEQQVYAGANVAWIGPANGQGGEYIQFATATLVGPQTWQLSDLLRGRRGTEHAVGTHGPGETFVLMLSSSVGRGNYGAADWNRERVFRPVSVYQEFDDAADQVFTNTGEGRRPLSPVHPLILRNASNDVTLSWTRRTRLEVPGMGNGFVPLGEESERYEVDILVGANVVRTIAATAPQITYSAADQTADGITPGNPVTGRVHQISAVRGRGRALEFNG